MTRSLIVRCGVASAAALSAGAANAQIGYSTGFEGLNANAQGVVLTGQDGYYLPVAGSTDFEVFTYSANSYRIPQNPTGGTRFIAGTGEANGTFERAQRDVNFGAGVGTWTMGYDILATYTGNLPSAQNIGSVSIQDFPGSQSFIALARWADPATAAEWNADYIHYNAAGAQVTSVVPDPAFQNLSIDHWYRWETDFNLSTNQITQLRLIDLTTGVIASHNPADWFLEGGSAGGAATPTGFRFFAGGGVAGNTLAFDNFVLVPTPGTMALLALGGLAAFRRRR
jgi:hypothetical protein